MAQSDSDVAVLLADATNLAHQLQFAALPRLGSFGAGTNPEGDAAISDDVTSHSIHSMDSTGDDKAAEYDDHDLVQGLPPSVPKVLPGLTPSCGGRSALAWHTWQEADSTHEALMANGNILNDALQPLGVTGSITSVVRRARVDWDGQARCPCLPR